MKFIYTILVLLLSTATYSQFDSRNYTYNSDNQENYIDYNQLYDLTQNMLIQDKALFDESEVEMLANMDKSELPTYTPKEIHERLQAIPTTIKLKYTPEVGELINYFAYKKRAYTIRMLTLSQDYFPIFEEVLSRKQMPLELKYLAIVESALNPTARSRCGATGLWQFMYKTAKYEGMTINTLVDERKDIYKSTEFATQYLTKLHKLYNDWPLALAAYNAGPGNVNRALRNSGGYDFWTAKSRLPRETQNYVPSFIAIMYVMHYHADYKLMPGISKLNLFNTYTERIYSKCTLKYVAELTGTEEETLKKFNPSLKKGIIPATTYGYDLIIPSSATGDLKSQSHLLASDPYLYQPKYNEPSYASNNNNLDNSSEQEYKIVKKVSYKKKWIRHKVRRGESLSKIASKYHVYVKDIKKWNKMRSSTVNRGARLKIYTKQKVVTPVYVKINKPKNIETEASETVVASTPSEVVPSTSDNNPIRHRVAKGETLYSISRTYDCNVDDIYSWNNLKNSKLYVGQSLIVKQAIADNTASQKSNLAKLYELTNYKFYKVAEGDTLQTASTKLNIPVDVLKSLNNLDENTPLQEGEEIKIPME